MAKLDKRILFTLENKVGLNYILLEKNIIKECNLGICHKLGYKTKRGLKNRSIYNILFNNDDKDFFKFFLNEIEKNPIEEKDIFLRGKKGKLVFFKIKAVPFDNDGILLLLMENGDCLFSSESIDFVNLFPDIFFVIKFDCNNGSSRFLFLNSRVEDILGFAPDEAYKLEKENPYFFHKEVLQENFENHIEELRNIINDGRKEFSKVIKVKDKFNNIKYLSISAEINRKEGDDVIFFGTARDVTELLDTQIRLINTENKMFEILNVIPQGVLLLSQDFKIQFINDYFVKLFDIPIQVVDTLEGKSIDNIDFLKDLNIFDEIANKLSENKHYQNYIWVKSKFQLKKMYLRIDGITIRNLNPKLYDILLIFTDLTGVKEIEIELNREFRYKSIEKFASGIAHNFNNILAALESNISFIKEMLNSPEPELERLMDIIVHTEKTSYKARIITDKLMSLSNSWEPKKKEISVDNLFYKYIVPALKKLYKNVEFNIKAHNVLVDADVSKLVFAVGNIYENAVEAIERKGKVFVVAEEYEEEHNKKKYLCIKIIDNGPGISDEILDKIFDPFFSTKSVGRGLGLSISKSVINSLGGFIKVNTELGKGTEFLIFVPLIYREAEKLPVQKSEVFPNSKVSGKILIMDDEVFIRDTLKTILGYLGYSVWEAVDATTAFNIYKEHYEKGEPFDLVIVDLIVPGGLGGLELIDLLKKYDKNVKAIVSSGYSSAKILSSYKEYGFIDVLSKPYNFKDLKDLLSKYFEE